MINTTQIHHRLRWLTQKIQHPKFAVIGGYHGGNLGDMALGISIKNSFSSVRIPSYLQTIYNLEKWPKATYAVIGGGAIGYIDSLNKVYERYRSDFSTVAFVGVDFNEPQYPPHLLNMLSNAAYVSCRSKEQADRLKEATNRETINYHPDVAYGLATELCAKSRLPEYPKSKKLLVNLVPLYGHYNGTRLEPSLQYRDERPELYQHFEEMHKNYALAVRSAVEEALDTDYTVETIPFTPQDDIYGRSVLKGLTVRHNAYHDNPIKMLEKISVSDTVIPTRFHATIFAIKTGANIRPIAYATKNALMFKAAGILPSAFLTSTDLAHGKNALPPAFRIEPQLVGQWERSVSQHIQEAINTLV